jgi:hypothetical protein
MGLLQGAGADAGAAACRAMHPACELSAVLPVGRVNFILKLFVALQMSSVLQAAVHDILREMERAPAGRRDELKRKMRKIVGDDRLQAMGIRVGN